MENKLSCEIVRDLLPSYADGLTSNATSSAVAAHLEGCPPCTEALRLMREPEPLHAESAEVDYLKKLRSRTSRVGLICGIVMMLVGMLLIFFRVFYVGSRVAPEDMYYRISVVDNTVYVDADFLSSSSGVARVVFEESAGIVSFKVYAAPIALFNSGSVSKQYTAHSDTVGQVRSGDLILWYDGTEISRPAAQLYAAANPYVGDMPANSRLASLLGISSQFGSFTSELQTGSEPYGWTILLDEPLPPAAFPNAKYLMTADSCVLLALIDNLGYVTWTYSTDAGEESYTVTAEDASYSRSVPEIEAGDGKSEPYLFWDIKERAETPVQLQQLLDSLCIRWAGIRSEMLWSVS